MHFSSSACGIFTKPDHILGQKTSPNISDIQNKFLTILQLNWKSITKNNRSISRDLEINPRFHNSWVEEWVMREIRNILSWVKMRNKWKPWLSKGWCQSGSGELCVERSFSLIQLLTFSSKALLYMGILANNNLGQPREKLRNTGSPW